MCQRAGCRSFRLALVSSAVAMAILGRPLLEEAVAVESFTTEITYKAARLGLLTLGPLTGDPNTDETLVGGGLLLEGGAGVRTAKMVGTHGDALEEATVAASNNHSAYVISSCHVGAAGGVRRGPGWA